MFRRKSSGFTLIEILLALTIIVMIVAIMAPAYNHFYARNNLDLAVQQFVQDLRRAQTLARSSTNDSGWGVYLTSADITIFEGSSYATRDNSSDELKNLPGGLSASGLTEITFLKASGVPNNFGTSTLTSLNNESRNVFINSQGTINY